MEGSGWAARVPTPSLYTPLTLAPRNPINQWQVGPWRRGARRHRVLKGDAKEGVDARAADARPGKRKTLTDAYLEYTHTVILVTDGEVVRGR